jgi:hypothetical protein
MSYEGNKISKNEFSGRSLAVFTSGGDSQGMNAALRAVVRMGVFLGCQVHFIHDGFQGMINGSVSFELATWSLVSGIVGLGGTIIGSSRCEEFKERAGRLKAAKNLVNHFFSSIFTNNSFNFECLNLFQGKIRHYKFDLYWRRWNASWGEQLKVRMAYFAQRAI